MTDKIVVLVTAAKLSECRKIARHLLQAKLAACVNITSPVQSIYRWHGKVVNGREHLMIIKSRRKLFPEIREAISKLHPYEVPEIICLPIAEGSQPYLKWMGENVK